MLIERLHSGINETKQRELELLVSCLHNHSIIQPTYNCKKPRMQTLFTQLTSEHCFDILIPLYCKFTVISWLNDCEDMKLVVPTHVVLFH